MSKLITPSLFGSIKWLETAPSSYQEKAYEDLRGMLARDQKWDPSPQIIRGMDFEKKVQEVLQKYKKDPEGLSNLKVSKEFREFLTACKGGEWQKKTKTYMTIDGTEYCLYGKIDVDFPIKIIDVKTTGKEPWKGFNHKFLSSAQHKIYCHNEKKPDFVYIIALFNDPKGGPLAKKISSVHYVNYHVDSFDKLTEEIREIIGEILMFFEQYPDLFKLFNTKYSKY